MMTDISEELTVSLKVMTKLCPDSWGKGIRGMKVYRAGEQMGEGVRDLSRAVRKRESSCVPEDSHLHTCHCENLRSHPNLVRFMVIMILYQQMNMV
jgi:hypothetical protein